MAGLHSKVDETAVAFEQEVVVVRAGLMACRPDQHVKSSLGRIPRLTGQSSHANKNTVVAEVYVELVSTPEVVVASHGQDRRCTRTRTPRWQ
jgi:hypothetical protein